jgi:hypothetical protein
MSIPDIRKGWPGRPWAFLSWPGWQWILAGLGWAWLMSVVIIVIIDVVFQAVVDFGAGLMTAMCESFGGCTPPRIHQSQPVPVWSPLLAVVSWGLLVALFAVPHRGPLVWVRFGLLIALGAASWVSAAMLLQAWYP